MTALKQLVLLGGGHAHVEVLRDFAERPDARRGDARDALSAAHLHRDGSGRDRRPLRAGGKRHRPRRPRAPRGRHARADVGVACESGGARGHVLRRHRGCVRRAFARRGIAARDRRRRRRRAPCDRGAADGETDARLGRGAVARARRQDQPGDDRGRRRRRRGARARDNHRFRRDLEGTVPHVRIITDTPVALPELPAGARRRLQRQLARRNIGFPTSRARWPRWPRITCASIPACNSCPTRPSGRPAGAPTNRSASPASPPTSADSSSPMTTCSR